MSPTELQSSTSEFRFRKSEALLRNILENAAVGMSLAGTDGRILYANRAFTEMFGYEAAECIGLGPADLVHPDHSRTATEQVSKLKGAEIAAYYAERRYIRKDGHEFWGKVSAIAG